MRIQNLLFIASGIIILCTSATSAEIRYESTKLLASDGQEDDNFGRSAGISGNVVIAGSSRNSAIAVYAGAAYLFDATTGVELFQLHADDGAQGDSFGFSVAIDGSIAIVGAHRDDDNGSNSGSAYLFDVATGQQMSKLVPDDGEPNEDFGISVSISGTIAVVGAYRDDDNGNDSGSAYVFDATTGLQLFKLVPDDVFGGNQFGWTVSIDGNNIIVGAPNHGPDSGPFAQDGPGAAYLFDASSGLQIDKFTAADGEDGDRFGTSVAIHNSAAVAGSPAYNSVDGGSGSAYLFDISTGIQTLKLSPDDGAAMDAFGSSVAICDDTVVVGSIFDDDNGASSGSAYVFRVSTGQQLMKLLPSSGDEYDIFSLPVGIDNDTVIIGAYQDDEIALDSGAAYLYDISICASDLNCDGAVDTADLGVLLGQFNTAGPDADINGDGVVDTADLGILLGVFGVACP